MGMNSITRRNLERAYEEFYADTGIGQFSYYRFAQWLMDNEPDITVNLLEQQLRQTDKLRGEAHGS